MSRYTAQDLTRARELRSAGWTYEQIARLLAREHGHTIHKRTVQLWLNDTARETHRQHGIRTARKAHAAAASFRLPGHTPEYRAAFMQRLADEGVSAPDIGKVCGVVFGERLSGGRVRYALAVSRPVRPRQTKDAA
jgi:hypothetical protein